jgi:hypothetical protein
MSNWLIQLADPIASADFISFMPDSNIDPEKYSIDEMLDRLKSRNDSSSQDDGELVTRSDGTKAIKVRKRKRRTDQPKDKLNAHNQRIQLVQIAGFMIFMVALLFIGGGLILYSNSSVFYDDFITKIESATGSKAKIQQFRMNPVTASAASLEMNWPKEHALERLEVNGLRAKIAPISFFGRFFQGQEAVADKGNLFLKAPQFQDSLSDHAASKELSKIKFGRYSVSGLNVFFSDQQPWSQMIENVEASYLPVKTSKGDEIRLNQGLLKMRGWPSLQLDRAYIQVRDHEFDIKSMRFEMPSKSNQKIHESGSINLSGIIRPSGENVTHQLSVGLDSFQISYLLGNGLGRFFQGKAVTNPDEASNSLQFTPTSGQDALLRLNMSNALDSRIALSQFKFLGQLAIALDDRWYEFPFFDDEVKLLMKRSGDMIQLEEIDLLQRTRMVVRGSLSVKDESGSISGTLKIGVPQIIITASKNRRLDALFGPVNEAYRWIQLEVGGTGVTPVDNFKELYEAVNLSSNPEVKTDSSANDVDSFDGLIEVK